MWLSIDPGVGYYAYAQWHGSELVGIGLVEGIRDSVIRPPPHALVIEKPQVYRHARTRSADIVDLAMSAQKIADLWPEARCTFVLPAEWKGQAPKRVTVARARKALTPNELPLMAGFRKTKASHIWDAVGIGLWYTGRK